MIANDNRRNGRTTDYTRTLEFLAHHLIAPGCQIVLDEAQFEVLKAYLSNIENIGDTNFVLEMCVDYRDHDSSNGYSLAWDNDGSRLQDDMIDAIMGDLVQHLGFAGASILREGELIDLTDIDGRIAEIKKRISDKHRVEKKLHKTVFDIEPKQQRRLNLRADQFNCRLQDAGFLRVSGTSFPSSSSCIISACRASSNGSGSGFSMS